MQGLQLIGVPCGTGNVLTNKGAVCVLLRVKNTSLAFVNAHLAAHEPNLQDRNDNYHRIRSEVLSRVDDVFLPVETERTTSVTSHIHDGGTPGEYIPVSLPVMSRPWTSVYWEQILAASGVPRDKTLLPFLSSSDRVDETSVQSISGNHQPSEMKTGAEADIKWLRGDGGKRGSDDWPFDAVFFFGDLNYRVKGLSRAQMDKFITHVRKIENKRHKKLKIKNVQARGISSSKLLKKPKSVMTVSSAALPLLNRVLSFDQLMEQIEKREAFSDFDESPVTFLPTYKLDRGSARFDSSEKQRCPSWTDRVLVWARNTARRTARVGDKEATGGASRRKRKGRRGAARTTAGNDQGARTLKVDAEEYSSYDVRHSDHRPVAATFTLKYARDPNSDPDLAE